MRAPGSAPTLAPDTPADQAFEALSAAPDRPLAVLDGNRMVGLLASADVMRWLHLHGRKQ
jgi:CBS-domain-containing membrane protein